MKKFSNNLIHETSNYLLQHAHNPVQWYAWNETAFQKARNENKPILVSIGYSACHWCHVMERESFEDERTAEFMNTHFINIKIDREERPDIDHIYMQACQMLTGSGGWPLNMFLTPELNAFTGGTYFPPKPGYGKPSWMEVLLFVHKLFTQEREKVEEQASTLMQYVENNSQTPVLQIPKIEGTFILQQSELEIIEKNIFSQADKIDGGFGQAPKFPSAMLLKFLIRKNYYSPDAFEIAQIKLTLNKMMNGGLYDQLAGGFSRYSTDTKWRIPHFEKMLYDNALLLQVYSEAFQLFGDENYKRIVIETAEFIHSEMMSAEFGFYSAFDADSEGEEGKYYVWSKHEILQLLPEHGDWFCEIMQITEKGNWEQNNILLPEILNSKDLTHEEAEILNACKKILLQARKKRNAPSLDDKIICSWNAMMSSGLIAAYRATTQTYFLDIAKRNVHFIYEKFSHRTEKGKLYHTYKNGKPSYSAMLDDYASLVEVSLDLFEATGEEIYLIKAKEINTYVINHFSSETGLFYFTELDAKDVPLRNIEYYDNATPSGNSIMAQNLIKLYHIQGDISFKEKADNMFISVKDYMIKYPSAFGYWLTSALRNFFPIAEIIITGLNNQTLLEKLNRHYYPNKFIINGNISGKNQFESLKNKPSSTENLIYVCKDFQCHTPVKTFEEFLQLIQQF